MKKALSNDGAFLYTGLRWGAYLYGSGLNCQILLIPENLF